MLTTTATAATGAALDLEAIKGALQGLDELGPRQMLTKRAALFSRILLVCRICVMLGPVLLVILGLCYLFLAPKEANYYFGYRCFYGMGSVNAWQFTQRMAGIILGSLGLMLPIVMALISMGFPSMETGARAWLPL